MFDWTKDPHRRFNPLTREWGLVSPHRTERPWQGQMETGAVAAQPDYDPDCYLCPGNARAGGVRNPAYSSTFVFDNDFVALKPGTPLNRFEQDGLLVAESEPGLCRVVCFAPRHNLTIANMDAAALRQVVDTWVEQYLELGARPEINYVQIFENRVAIMLVAESEPGLCRVVCFAPRHNLTSANLVAGVMPQVVDTWVEQSLELGGRIHIGDR